jgi:hypothetical protein
MNFFKIVRNLIRLAISSVLLGSERVRCRLGEDRMYLLFLKARTCDSRMYLIPSFMTRINFINGLWNGSSVKDSNCSCLIPVVVAYGMGVL